MFSETFFPMAAANSVPRTVRKYHYEHFPPPSDSTELTAELCRGLRAVPHGGFWSKVKSVGWRLLREQFIHLCPCTINVTDDILVVKFDSRVEQPLRRPDFPVAPPSSPLPRTRKLSPDIHIHPAGCPDFLLSPPLPQEDGFLFVPARSFRAPRRRLERLPPSPRPLPTPPGPPACPIPKIACCPWANGPSTPSSSSSSLSSVSASSLSPANSDVDTEGLDCARFLINVAPFLFFPDEENNLVHDDQKPQGLDAPEPSAVAGSENMVQPVSQDDVVIMTSSQTEEIRHAAADRHFLEELGLTPQTFMALLDGNGIEWDEDEEDEDDGGEDGDGDGEEEEDQD